ncbi:hypothetical protein AYI70_g2421 [Smittium culicis]|uniref:Uncharacterized protein n=1 Tax=Smittium culicis TaxID=133412 RepID=A0A1R1Y8E5_9FUNG|nr:hypothetical protein AYI70_g2421 [Smittium culicis]
MRKFMIGFYFFVVFVISDFIDGQDSIKYKKTDNESDKKPIEKVKKSPEKEITYTSKSDDKHENQRDKGMSEKAIGRYRNTSPDQPIIGSFVNYGGEALGEGFNNLLDASKPENQGKDNIDPQKDQQSQTPSEEQLQDSGPTQSQYQPQSDSQNKIPSSILNTIPGLQSMPQLQPQIQSLTQTQIQPESQPDQTQPIVTPEVPPPQSNNNQIPQVITTTVVYTVSAKVSPSQPTKTQGQNQDEQTANVSNYPQLSSSTKLRAHSTLKILAPTNIIQNSFALTSISILVALAIIIGFIPVPWPE